MKEYMIILTLTEEMLGTVPKDPDIYTKFIESKKPPENIDVEADYVDEKPGWTGFCSNEQGLFVWDYFIKGFLKNAGNVMKEQIGIKALKKKIGDYVFVFPRQISLENEKGVIKEPDGVNERSLRGQTPQGPRVSLAKSDTVKPGTKIDFTLKVLRPTIINKKVLEQIFDYGQFQGLGQWRNGGWGRFNYEISEK